MYIIPSRVMSGHGVSRSNLGPFRSVPACRGDVSRASSHNPNLFSWLSIDHQCTRIRYLHLHLPCSVLTLIYAIKTCAMASKDVNLVVLPRGKPIRNLPAEIKLPRAGTSAELYQKLAALAGTSIHRLRVTKGNDGSLVPNSRDVLLSQTGLMSDSKIIVKDLGNIREEGFHWPE